VIKLREVRREGNRASVSELRNLYTFSGAKPQCKRLPRTPRLGWVIIRVLKTGFGLICLNMIHIIQCTEQIGLEVMF
jgi:hypothetical protein